MQKKTLKRFLQHTHTLIRESYSSLSKNSLVVSSSFSLPLLYLERRFVPNTTHAYSKCRECFGTWKALGICQKKPVRLGGRNRAVLRDLDN